jgi:hypothetical protein
MVLGFLEIPFVRPVERFESCVFSCVPQ